MSYVIVENEPRVLTPLSQVLIDWINDVLVGERIIVKDLAEDLYDGQVLQKLFGKKPTLVQHSKKPSYFHLSVRCEWKSVILLLFVQRNWKERSLMSLRLHSPRLPRSRSFRLSWKRSMTHSKCPPGTSNGTLTVNRFMFWINQSQHVCSGFCLVKCERPLLCIQTAILSN